MNLKNKKSLIAIICILIYGFLIEPNQLKVTNYSIPNDALSGVRLVFISDLHAKTNQYNRLRKVVNKINELNPDVIVSTGDFVNGKKESDGMPITNIAEILGLINSNNRFYTVLGEYDLTRNRTVVIKSLAKNNITVLGNSYRKVPVKNGKALNIVGIEGIGGGRVELNKMLSTIMGPTIVLSHSPDILSEVPPNVILTLAGHTHGGVINIPFIGGLFVQRDLNRKHAKGFVSQDSKNMIVTTGIGTSVVPFRLNCIPEIVVITFK